MKNFTSLKIIIIRLVLKFIFNTIYKNFFYFLVKILKKFTSSNSRLFIINIYKKYLYFLDPSYVYLRLYFFFLVRNKYSDLDSQLLNKKINNKNLVIVFPIIDWNFRWQRPQQLISRLSKKDSCHYLYLSIEPLLVLDEYFYNSSSYFSHYFNTQYVSKNITLINFLSFGKQNIYQGIFSTKQKLYLYKIISKIIFNNYPKNLSFIVQHPGWYSIVNNLFTKFRPNIIYDCMDYHVGFSNIDKKILSFEKKLFTISDTVIASSNFLYQYCKKFNSNTVLIKNATEFSHFSKASTIIKKKKPNDQIIIGYFGAISDWFDYDLLYYASNSRLNYKFIIIGNQSVHSKLDFPNNVNFLGEVPYSKIPNFLSTFDVCIIPFKINNLTRATNPVKFYEYISSGKPVVSTNLPELTDYQEYVFLSKNKKEFVKFIDKALINNTKYNQKNRINLAKKNTWESRARDFNKELSSVNINNFKNSYFKLTKPKKIPKNIFVSIIIVSFNNCNLLKNCLASIANFTKISHEIVIVDNDSNFETKQFLKQWSLLNNKNKVIFNKKNYGFSKANNIGIRNSKGNFFLMLNNDTYVTPNWLEKLVTHYISNNNIGAVGPITNNIGNEAKIDISYDSYEEMISKSESYTLNRKHLFFNIKNVAFFCVLISKKTFSKIGYLNEEYGLGFFEDDDYCKRINKAGLKVICAEDTFVHHELSASFNKVKLKTRKQLFEKNKKIYENKWGEWISHEPRF